MSFKLYFSVSDMEYDSYVALVCFIQCLDVSYHSFFVENYELFAALRDNESRAQVKRSLLFRFVSDVIKRHR